MIDNKDPLDSYITGELSLAELTQACWVNLRQNPECAEHWLSRLQTLNQKGEIDSDAFRELTNMTQSFVNNMSNRYENMNKKMSAIERQKACYTAALEQAAPVIHALDDGHNFEQPSKAYAKVDAVQQQAVVKASAPTPAQHRFEQANPQSVTVADDGFVIPAVKNLSYDQKPTGKLEPLGKTSHFTQSLLASERGKDVDISGLVSASLEQHDPTQSSSSGLKAVRPSSDTRPKRFKTLKIILIILCVLILSLASLKAFAPDRLSWLSQPSILSLLEKMGSILPVQSKPPANTLAPDSTTSGYVPQQKTSLTTASSHPIQQSGSGVLYSEKKVSSQIPSGLSVDQILINLVKACEQGLIEPASKPGTALYWMAQMAMSFDGHPFVEKGKSALIEAYLEQARQARQDKAWSKSVSLVSKALKLRAELSTPDKTP